jgi:hypothetical protein
MCHLSNCSPDLSSSAAVPILRSAPLGGEGKVAFLALVKPIYQGLTLFRALNIEL